MKVTEGNIYYFLLIKGYLVPTLIIHNKDPEGEKGKELLAYSLTQSVKLLKSILKVEIADKVLKYIKDFLLLVNRSIKNDCNN